MTTLENNNDYFDDQQHDHRAIANNRIDSLFDRLKKAISLAEMLRLLGAGAVIVSMSLFLLNGWSEGNDIQRYLKLLAQTGLLTGAGLTMSFLLKENKGARLFFALSLISVVANFTVLGALTYSMFQLDGSLTQYPSMMTWKAFDSATFWPIFAGAIILLTILTKFSFRIFARNIAAPLSNNFLLMSSLLLIPIRSSITVSIIAIISIWFASTLVKKLKQDDAMVFTNESKFALALMFVPGILIIVRALSLYHVDEITLITIESLFYFSLRSLRFAFNHSSLMTTLSESARFFTGIFISIQLTSLIPYAFDDIGLVAFSLFVMLFSYDQIKTTSSVKWQRSILTLTTIGLVIISSMYVIFSDSFLIQISSLLITSVLYGLAHYLQASIGNNRNSKLIASLGITICIFALLGQFIEFIQLGNWIIVGLIGATLIIGSSLYERYKTSRSKALTAT